MMSQRYAIPLAGLAVFCIFALASIQSPRAGKTALEEINGDAHNLPESGETVDRPHETTEMVYAEQHPVYTRCAKRVDMPEFVKTIRKTCGNIHELTTLAPPCHNMLAQKAEDFGCCWETVMTAYRQLDPQAHHSWRMWQGTVSGKAGITFGEKSCGDAMGENDFRHLESEVKGLKDTVSEQQQDLQVISGILMMAMGFKGGPQSLKQTGLTHGQIRATHAPFSAADLSEALQEVQGRRRTDLESHQMMGRRSAHARHALHQTKSKIGKGLSQNPSRDQGVEKMKEAGIKV